MIFIESDKIQTASIPNRYPWRLHCNALLSIYFNRTNREPFSALLSNLGTVSNQFLILRSFMAWSNMYEVHLGQPNMKLSRAVPVFWCFWTVNRIVFSPHWSFANVSIIKQNEGSILSSTIAYKKGWCLVVKILLRLKKKNLRKLSILYFLKEILYKRPYRMPSLSQRVFFTVSRALLVRKSWCSKFAVKWLLIAWPPLFPEKWDFATLNLISSETIISKNEWQRSTNSE